MCLSTQVVHDLLAEQPRAQVELQKTASGFDIPGLTTVGAPCNMQMLVGLTSL